jgi:hypothetical protein
LSTIIVFSFIRTPCVNSFKTLGSSDDPSRNKTMQDSQTLILRSRDHPEIVIARTQTQEKYFFPCGMHARGGGPGEFDFAPSQKRSMKSPALFEFPEIFRGRRPFVESFRRMTKSLRNGAKRI